MKSKNNNFVSKKERRRKNTQIHSFTRAHTYTMRDIKEYS